MNILERSVSMQHQSAALPDEVVGLIDVLGRLYDLIGRLTDDEYRDKPKGLHQSGIAAHVRHNLDHVTALIVGLRRGRINYDDRERGGIIETCRIAALEAVARLREELLNQRWEDFPEELTMVSLAVADRPPVELATSVRREALFVLSHTIHHNAIIGFIAESMGIPLSPEFGCAPSTIQHRRRRECAP